MIPLDYGHLFLPPSGDPGHHEARSLDQSSRLDAFVGHSSYQVSFDHFVTSPVFLLLYLLSVA